MGRPPHVPDDLIRKHLPAWKRLYRNPSEAWAALRLEGIRIRRNRLYELWRESDAPNRKRAG